MSQHLVKELQRLKHEVILLKEERWGGKTPGQILSEIQSRIEHIEKKLDIGENDWLTDEAYSIDPRVSPREREVRRRAALGNAYRPDEEDLDFQAKDRD